MSRLYKDTVKDESLASSAMPVDAACVSPQEPRAAGSRYRDALASPEFRALFAAYTISMVGSVVAAVALTVLVYERTGSPFLSSLTFALAFAPFLVTGMFLSAIVDRVPIRRLLVVCDLGCAATVVPMAVPGMPVGALLALLTLLGLLASISGGARSALIPRLVPHDAYVPARSLMRITGQTTQIAGNALGGALLLALSPTGVLAINAATFVFSAALVGTGLVARPTAHAAAGRPALVGDSLSGLRAVLRRQPLGRLLALSWLIPTFAVAPEALAAPYVSSHGGSAALVGIWLVAIPIGFVAGDLAGVWALSPERQRRLVTPLAVVVFVPLLGFAADPSFAVAFLLLVVSGIGAAYGLGLDALIRNAASGELLGRALAINTSGLVALQGAGFAAAGALAEVVPPAATIVAAGVAGLVVVALLRPGAEGIAAATVPTRSP